MKIYKISTLLDNETEEIDVSYELLEENNWRQRNYQFYFPNPPYVIDTDTPLNQFELTLGKDFLALEDTMKDAMQAASDHYQGYLEPQKRKEVTPYDKIESLYGYTNDFNRAGYITEDGQLVNLNRPHIDHRAVTEDGSTESMQKFIADGNIRMSLSNGYATLDIKARPTTGQYQQIRRLLESVNDGISIDFSRGIEENKGRGTYSDIDRESLQVNGVPDVSSILGTIMAYYQGRKPSEISKFR